MPTFDYSAWDGSQHFRPLSAAAAFDRLADYLLEHGGYVLRQPEHSEPDKADLLRLLVREGYLEPDGRGHYVVAARGVRRIEEKVLRELFVTPHRDGPGKHDTAHAGAGVARHESSRAYEYGDTPADLNLHETLRRALRRQGARTPLNLDEDDLVVYETEHQAGCATVLLLDMSGSMARYGKFAQAKRVALALLALVRSHFPEDTLRTIGFYTFAAPLSERALVAAAPRPVNTFDSRVFLRVPLDDPPPGAPEHFTNIQAGLRLARHALRREAARNKQIVCVTDGEPTAHVEGREAVLVYPPGDRTTRATLEEVRRCTGEGIRISTFALTEDSFSLGLMNFVEQMARQSRGLAVYCRAGRLGRYVLDRFVNGRRSRNPVG